MVVKGIIPEQCRLRTAQQRSRAASRFQLRCRQNWPWQRARQNAVGLQLQHILSMLILLQLTKPTQSCHITNFLVHQGLQSKTEGRMQPKHDLNLCGIFFFLPLWGGKTCYGSATQTLATVYCKACYKHIQNINIIVFLHVCIFI